MKPKKKVASGEKPQASGEKESDTDPHAVSLAELLADDFKKFYADEIQLFEGFQASKFQPEFLSDESMRTLLPGHDAFMRMLDHTHGHDIQGRLATHAFYLVMPPCENTEELLHPIYKEGLCGGLLFRQLQDAYEKGDAGFFLKLADMIKARSVETPNAFDQLAYALRAKLNLENDGKPVTKKAVKELAEKMRAEYLIRSRGQTPSPGLIKLETDRFGWDWQKRIWKKHPDLIGLPKDKGGAPRKRK